MMTWIAAAKIRAALRHAVSSMSKRDGNIQGESSLINSSVLVCSPLSTGHSKTNLNLLGGAADTTLPVSDKLPVFSGVFVAP